MFQYYVILSQDWDSSRTIYKSYCQVVRKIKRNVPIIRIHNIKDIFYYSSFYKIEPTLDLVKLKRDVKSRIDKIPYEQDLSKYITDKINEDYSKDIISAKNLERLCDLERSLIFYFPDDDKELRKTYKVTTPNLNSRDAQAEFFYPDRIQYLMDQGKIDANMYLKNKIKQFQNINGGIEIHVQQVRHSQLHPVLNFIQEIIHWIFRIINSN
jgi:hypothetical protein